MKIYVFGNEDLNFDNAAIKVAKKLDSDFEFEFVKPNQDFPSQDSEMIILDTVQGIKTPQIIDENHLVTQSSTTAHDFDLGFQIKYLKKLGKLQKITIVGIPMTGEPDYSSIQSILRKLVVQDIQGS